MMKKMLVLLSLPLLGYGQQQQPMGTRAGQFGYWIPETAAYRARLNYRAEQVKRIEQSQERWDALMNLAMTGVLVKNFTKMGYEVVQTPANLHMALNETLHKALRMGATRQEGKVDQISGPVAQFVNVGGVRSSVQYGMQPLMEAWAGVPLVSTTAYGLRVYQPGNTLTMHTDRMETHVISCIVHVDRDLDEPWPIVIEGFDGRSVEVDLQPGQTLFYESAKCVHGRPRPMKGRWYTSLFVHYKPLDWNLRTNDARKVIEPYWQRFKAKPDKAKYHRLRLTGTGYYEPDCLHRWCHLSPDWPPKGNITPTDVSMLVAPDLIGLPTTSHNNNPEEDKEL